MPFTPPDFYWKDALLGISCELLLCSLIWFEEATLLSGFQSTYLRNTQFFLEQVSIFLHSEEFRIIVHELDSACDVFLVSPFRSRLETTMAGRNKGGWGLLLRLLYKCDSAFPRRSRRDCYIVGRAWFWCLTSPVSSRGICHQVAWRTCLLDSLRGYGFGMKTRRHPPIISCQLQALCGPVWPTPQGSNVTGHCPHSAWSHQTTICTRHGGPVRQSSES